MAVSENFYQKTKTEGAAGAAEEPSSEGQGARRKAKAAEKGYETEASVSSDMLTPIKKRPRTLDWSTPDHDLVLSLLETGGNHEEYVKAIASSLDPKKLIVPSFAHTTECLLTAEFAALMTLDEDELEADPSFLVVFAMMKRGHEAGHRMLKEQLANGTF
jgi:hypothetical protein